jgi:hypothetical protein
MTLASNIAKTNECPKHLPMISAMEFPLYITSNAKVNTIKKQSKINTILK